MRFHGGGRRGAEETLVLIGLVLALLVGLRWAARVGRLRHLGLLHRVVLRICGWLFRVHLAVHH